MEKMEREISEGLLKLTEQNRAHFLDALRSLRVAQEQALAKDVSTDAIAPYENENDKINKESKKG